jgi:hypothetical protein
VVPAKKSNTRNTTRGYISNNNNNDNDTKGINSLSRIKWRISLKMNMKGYKKSKKTIVLDGWLPRKPRRTMFLTELSLLAMYQVYWRFYMQGSEKRM